MDIFKIQVSLNDGGKTVLVYNRDKSYVYQGPIPKELKKRLKGRAKIYCVCTVDGDTLDIYEEVGAQTW